MKQVLAACIDQIIRFDSTRALITFEADMARKNRYYELRIIQRYPDGVIDCRVKRQYNTSPMLDEGGWGNAE